MSFELKFDHGAFDRAMREAVRDGVESIRQDYQALFDRLSRTHKGRPVAEIESVLAAEFRQRGGDLTPAKLRQYAERVTEGRHIEFRLDSNGL
jgi:hypothetical protein